MQASPLLYTVSGPEVAGGAGAGLEPGVVGVVGVVGSVCDVGAGEVPEAAVVLSEEELLEPQPLNAKMKEKQANCANAAIPYEPYPISTPFRCLVSKPERER